MGNILERIPRQAVSGAFSQALRDIKTAPDSMPKALRPAAPLRRTTSLGVTGGHDGGPARGQLGSSGSYRDAGRAIAGRSDDTPIW